MRRLGYLLALLGFVAALALGARYLVTIGGILSQGESAPAPAPAASTETIAPAARSEGKHAVASPDTALALAPAAEPAPALAPGASDRPAAPPARAARLSSAGVRETRSAPRPPATPPAVSVAEPNAAADTLGKAEAPVAPAPAAEPPVWQASPRQRARDSAYVMVNSGRLREAIDVLAAWVAREPTDTAVVLDLARLYARARQWDASLAQYTHLLALQRTAPLLYERGQVFLWSGNDERGVADLLAAEAIAPRAETQRQLGDYYRWQGALQESSYWYQKARLTAPGDSAVLSGLAQLDRVYDARLRRPGDLEARDLGSTAQYTRDNAGFLLASFRLGQAWGIGGGTTVIAASLEQRSAARASALGDDGSLGAFGADLSLSTRFGGTKLSGSVGVLDHDRWAQVVRSQVAVDALAGSARLSASFRRAPAYELLWAPRLLGVSCCDDGETPISASLVQASASFPFAFGTELWASGEYLDVRDDSRATLQYAVRRRLAGPFSLLYSGGWFGHEAWSPDYYSPERYLSQSLGVEWARYREHSSFAARLTPGYSWIREGSLLGTGPRESQFQLVGGLEFGFRRNGWDLLFSSGLGTGRQGGYRAGNANLYVRRAW